MWSAMLSIGGWVIFCAVLFCYVRWATLERRFFSGQDPENWKPDFQIETSTVEREHSALIERLFRIPSLGWPA